MSQPAHADHTSAPPRSPYAGLPAARTPAAPDTPGVWERAGRELLAKAIAEFSYEDLLRPRPDPAPCPNTVTRPGPDTEPDPDTVTSGATSPRPEEDQDGAAADYRVDLPGEVVYRFRARRGAYGAWHVDADGITREGTGGRENAHDVLRFLLDAHSTLGLTGDTAGHLVRELTATLAADARVAATARPVADLADLGYAELEGHQTGHPWIVPNKGRVGFSARDAATYAPEARRPMRLPWIAVHRDLAEYRGVDELPYQRLCADELDPGTRDRFRDRLTARGTDPAHYLWMPVHPWQWDETIATLFAPEVAAGRIIPLGEAPDHYLAQQSVRTFLAVDQPRRRTVKLPLSVLNTLVWRGLPTERTLAAPAVTTWVLGLREQDPFLREECRVVLLGETASVTVRHPVLEELPGVPYQYRELLGVIWREPLPPQLDPGERARTLAALLYRAPDGRSFVAELLARSGLTAESWLARLFHALLPPLLHYLYRYGVVFSPHGENAILLCDENDVPVRLAVKDFVDDVNTTDQPLPELADMPAAVRAVLLQEPPDFLCQFLHSGLFVGHFRYLAHLAARELGVPQRRFWALVRDEITAYHRRFPELADRFRLFDLFTARIDRLCLNRNRLLLDGYRDRTDRPHAAVHGTVPNPLHTPPHPTTPGQDPTRPGTNS